MADNHAKHTIQPNQSSEPINIRIAVVLEGGLIQAIIADDPTNLSVICIDYDTEGCDEDELTQVKQSDGSFSLATCTHECVSEATIDLDSVFGTSSSWVIRKVNADDRKSLDVRLSEKAMLKRINNSEDNTHE